MATSIVPFSRDLAQQLIDGGESFPVDFDLAWQWLGYSRKDHAVRKLKHFREGRDFLKLGEISATKPIQRFWLSIDCFKSLGMMAQTDQGDLIREYFIDCEKIAKAATAIKPAMDRLALMQESLNLLIEHESRLEVIEQQNALLVEQNSLLTQQCGMLRSQVEVVELETEANKAELSRYKNGHGRYYTIAAWCNLHGFMKSLQECTVLGRKAAAFCRIRDIVPQPVQDPRFGTVNSYPDSVLEELDF